MRALPQYSARQISKKITTLVRATVSDFSSILAKKLHKTVHDIAIKKQLLEYENQGYQEALTVRKRRQNKGKKLPFKEPEGYHRGGVFWSPHSVQRSRDLLAEQEAEKQQNKAQKIELLELRKSTQLTREKLKEERRIALAAARERRVKGKAAKASSKALKQATQKAKE